MHIRNLTLTLFLLWMPLSMCVKADTSLRQIDSLKQQLPMLEGEDKLNAYFAIHQLYLREHNLDTHLTFLQDYMIEADREQDTRSGCYARLSVISLLFNYGEFSRAQEAIDSYKSFLEKSQRWYYYFQACNIRFNIFICEKKTNEALVLAEKIYQYAREHELREGIAIARYFMGRVYLLMERWEESEAAFKEVVVLLKDPTPAEQSTLENTYLYYTDLLYRLERYNDMLPLLTEWYELLEKTNQLSDQMAVNPFYLACVNYYAEMKQFNQAEEYLKKIESLSMVMNVPIGKGQYYVKKSRLRELQGRYTEALALTDSLYETSTKNSDALGVAHALKLRARIARSAGLADKAYDALIGHLLLTDSIHKVDISAKVDELHTQYEVDRHISEKVQARNYFLLALSVCLLLIALAVGTVIHSRKLVRKNRGLVRQIRAQDQISKQLNILEEENRKLQVLLKNTIPMSSDNKNEEEDTLYLNLKELMLKEKYFTKTGLTRKELADKLNTNERYLRECIMKHFTMTFAEYITSLRLNYARELLANSSNKETIESISMDAGFGSRMTFYRLFREYYELSPDEYRKFAHSK